MTTNATLGFTGETVVILRGKLHPRLFVDVRPCAGGWEASFGFDMGRVGGLDAWHGPYCSRLAAITNATLFGLDMLRPRLQVQRGQGTDGFVRRWLSGFGRPQLHQGELAL